MDKNNIEDIYPLAPMQKGMLFHTLSAPESGVYFQQTVYTLDGDLDVSAFMRAWQRVVERHPILRTLFLWEQRDEPLQVVRQRVKLPWMQHDWRGLSPAEQQERLEVFLEADRDRGFELSRAPLMRLFLIQVAEDAYYFIWSRHHLLLDMWSGSLVLKDVCAFHKAFQQGEDLYLEPAPSYRDYIAWLRRQDLSRAEVFWRQGLKGFTTPTALEVDRASGSMSGQQIVYGKQQLRLSRAATAALQSLAREQRLTLSTLVQGAWALLLSRYSGEEDVIFGATVSGRPPELPGVESMVGLFINTLPVRVQVAADESLVPWLKRLQSQMVELRQYEYSPLVEVQRWSEIPRGLPLFESILAFENSAVGGFLNELDGGLNVRSLRSEGGRTGYPLTTLALPGQELLLQISYDCRRFDTLTITRRLGHFQQLLEGIATDPERRLSELPLLTEAEREQVLVEWNQTAVAYPKDVCLPQLFEAQVERAPATVAVVCEGQTLTYWELNRKANQLAHYLKGLGVGPEVLVGICVERSLEMVIGLLGILKAGGAYVPLDPAYPKERLAFMLQDAQALVLLTQQRLVERLPHYGTKVVCLDTDWGAIAQEGEANLLCQGTTDNLAYVLYTSGSTGRPKGVAMSHRPLCNLLSWQLQNSTLPSGARTLQFASLSFDVSFQEIFSTWCSGGTLVLISEEMRRDAVGLWHYLTDEAVARLFLPFVALQQLAEVVEDQGSILTGVREIITAGEQLQITRQIASLFGKLKGCTLHNQYGPCESHVVTAFTLTGSPSDWPALPPIGCPIANTQIYLLDSHLQPVPVGVLGELYIGGVGLARGYLNRPELTAEKFIPSPFSIEPGARLYKTGDLARYRPDGHIEFRGRIDHQVKIRGFRIELGEVEAVLSQHPAVRESVVAVREDTPGDKRLVAYVVARQGPVPAESELRGFLKEQLPAHMLPSAFVLLDALPLTPSGKVDRRALPAPDQVRPELGKAFIAPRTPVEEVLAGIWADVLRLEEVGVHDNFFELGGHSLLATQIMSRLCRTFQVELPLRTLFATPTVAGLADGLETTGRAKRGLQTPPVLPVSRGGTLPLSFAQERLWFLAQLEPDSSAYHIPAAFRLTGALNVTALERSLNEIVRRHEALRTTLASVDGSPVQIIAENRTVPLPALDLSASPETEHEAALRHLNAEAQRPFNLAHDLPLRATLLRLGEQEHVLLLVMHHITSDAWSLGVFLRELAVLYGTFSAGEPSPLPELSVQYADYAVWQRQQLQGVALDHHLTYWRRQLAGLHPVEVPTDRPRPAVRTPRGARHSFVLSQTLSAALHALSRQEGATLFMTLLAALQTLLHRYTGEDDIAVGAPIAGRTQVETEGLIGCFINTLVLRTDLAGDPTFRELLGRVQEVALGAYAHQDLPFEKLVEELQPERNLSHAPLFQVLFALQNAPTSAIELPGLIVSPVPVDKSTAKFDLTLTLVEGTDGLRATVEYNTDLFDAATITRLLGHFQTILEGIVADPEQRISALPLMTAAERQQLLEWNDTTKEYPRGQCLHQLFEAQVAQTPTAVAVVCEGQELTYRELNRRANQLAHYLQSLGVGPEVLVGICVERSVEMVVGLLGILKAGGAYVPLDPTYPKDRLAFMLEDTQAPVLLTQERLVSGLPRHRAQIVCLDADWESIAQESEANPASTVQPENLAYVIYTSGSTGQPKGVLVSHYNVVRLFAATQPWFRFDEHDVWTLFHSFAFDLSVWELWGALLYGGRLVMVPYWVSRSPDAFYDLLSREQVTVLNQTPSAFRQFIWAEESTGATKDLALRLVLFGGEPLEFQGLRRWFGRHGDQCPRLVNMYGITETTVHVTYRPLVAADASITSCSMIGGPIPDMQVFVLDRYLQPVPLGVPGELYVSGAGLARGYLNQPELTTERFIPHPFSDEPGARLYKTGDLARYRPDGDLEYLGRIDHQVKLRGFRIELGEVEAVLGQHPAVRETVVIARNDSLGEKCLVAYIVSRREPTPTVNELSSFLHEKLPAYMVPSTFMFLDELPLTPNGKVDRRTLPAPDRVEFTRRSIRVAPRDTLELQLTQIWEDILGLRPVGVTDNFFDLGGHSLSVVRLIARIHKQFGQELPLPTLFQGATIEQLAGVLRRSPTPQRRSPVVGIHLSGSRRPFFCVHAVGGSVLCYAGLSRRLGPDQPFYGLQHPGLDGESDLYTCIEEIASDYLAALRAVQPEDPYLLGGWSLGGIIAFEMAQQLEAQGQKVALLALLDASALAPEQSSAAAIEGTALWALAQDLGFGLDDATFLSDHLSRLAPDEQLTYILERVRAAHLAPPDVGLAQLRRHLHVLQTNLRARQGYRPQEYPGLITLLRACEQSGVAPQDPTLGWGKLATGGVEVQPVPGNHYTMLREPHVQVLAERLRTVLRDVQADEFGGNHPRTVAIAPREQRIVKIERRPLLSLFATGEGAPVDAAAVGSLPSELLVRTGLSRDEVIHGWYDNLPTLTAILETSWGRIAVIRLPRFSAELYNDKADLVRVIVEALEIAGRLGARTVSLTGLIPSATDYGRAVAEAISGRNDLPLISTGHATTVATVVLAVKKILQEGGRNLAQEKVGFLGLGSIGLTSLRLMLSCLPHPKSVTLCDVYSKRDSLEKIRHELVRALGFRGLMRVVEARTEVPPEFYDATLIIGATNVPDILDLTRVNPGTIIVDDSAPSCFVHEDAVRRFREQEDILFTAGGVLRSPHPIGQLRYVPRAVEPAMNSAYWEVFSRSNPWRITGCILSGLLSSRFTDLKPTVGIVDASTCVQHYELLGQLGFQAADLHCRGYVLAEESIRTFRRRFGDGSNSVEEEAK